MAAYKQLTEDQLSFMRKNGSSMTLLEMSRALKLSTTKVKYELDELGITPFVKMPMTVSKIHIPHPKHIYPSGLKPNISKPFIRPPAIYSNTNKSLYKELQ